MSTPLYQLKAEFFKTLGHPARIRVLELLSEREQPERVQRFQEVETVRDVHTGGAGQQPEVDV
ncbi:hypothetical protein ABZ372_39240, partial [Streptomyces sp. NPDC005921]